MAVKASNQITITDITDAYSVILTSEAYTFVGGTSGAASGSTCTTQAVAYCGGTQKAVSVTDSSIVCPSGISASVSSSGTPAVATITFTLTATLSAAAEATIPVEVDGITINKKFSFAVAKTGQQGNPGQNGTSVTVSGTTYEYAKSTSGTTPPSSGWGSTPVAPTTTEYAWTKTTTTFSDNSTAVTYTVGGKVGQQGQQGNPGTNGTSPTVTNSKTQYQKSSNGTSVPTGTWSDTALAPTTSEYVWTKTTITYSDGATAVTYAVAGKQGTQGNPGADAIEVSITSNNGVIFKNNSGSTVLTAHVYKGGIAASINSSGVATISSTTIGTVKWYKGDTSATQPSGWPKSANAITISASDVANSQPYTCTLEA